MTDSAFEARKRMRERLIASAPVHTGLFCADGEPAEFERGQTGDACKRCGALCADHMSVRRAT